MIRMSATRNQYQQASVIAQNNANVLLCIVDESIAF